MFRCVFERFGDVVALPIFGQNTKAIAFGTLHFGGNFAAKNPYKLGTILEPFTSALQWCSFKRNCIKYVLKKRVRNLCDLPANYQIRTKKYVPSLKWACSLLQSSHANETYADANYIHRAINSCHISHS